MAWGRGVLVGMVVVLAAQAWFGRNPRLSPHRTLTRPRGG
jgi:hypothetical protein